MLAGQQGERRKKHPRPTNMHSNLITGSENDVLFSMLGNDNYTLSSGVAQLLVAQPAAGHQWTRVCAGVVCLVKDYAEKAYFIRMFDPMNRTPLPLDQQLYEDIRINRVHRLLITFEGNTCVYGLNFSSEAEIQHFKEAVDRRMDQERRRKFIPSSAPLSSAASLGGSHRVAAVTSNSSLGVVAPSRNAASPASYIDAYNSANRGSGNKKQKKSKKKLTKEDISLPTNFQHKVHVGWNPEKGFEADDVDDGVDPSIKELLGIVGVKKLRKGDKKLVYQIVEQFGGAEAVQRELAQSRHEESIVPALPQQRSPAAGVLNQTMRTNQRPQQISQPAPPPPPPRDASTPIGPPRQAPQSRPLPAVPQSRPQPPSCSVPAPPPRVPVSASGQLQSGRQLRSESVKNEHSPAAVMAPPPPPPPPPLPVAASVPPAPKAAPTGRNDLLADIRRGAQLRSVESAPQAPASCGEDSRDQVMSQIRQGVSLKPVEASENRTSQQGGELGGLAGALLKALADRRGQLKDSDSDGSSDDDDDDEGQDDDEWDDQ